MSASDPEGRLRALEVLGDVADGRPNLVSAMAMLFASLDLRDEQLGKATLEADRLRTEVAALTAERDEARARRFPVHTPTGGAPSSVPWSALVPHEPWALRNHSQDLETLAGRGGLSVCEMVAIIEGRRWYRMDNAAAVARLRELLAHCPMCGAERTT